MRRLVGLLVVVTGLWGAPSWASEEIGRQEDTAAADGQVLMPTGCVRQDTLASSTSADGDYAHMKCTAAGRLYADTDTELPAPIASADDLSNPTAPGVISYLHCWDPTGGNWDRCRAAINYTEDAASAGGEQLSLVGGVRQDTLATSTSADGDYAYFKFDSIGAAWIRCSAGCSGGAQFAEDTASAGAELLTLAGFVRQDTLASSTSADGDYASGKVDSAGAIWMRCSQGCGGGTQFAEDTASANGDLLTVAGAMRQATPSNTSGADGDYEALRMNNGRLWVSALLDTALPTGSNTIGNVGNTGTFAVQDSQALTDDGAFTVASSKLFGAGFFANETSPDSVNEGDVGAGRMTLDRVLWTAPAAVSATSQGAATCYITSAATTNATNCKGASGNVYGVRAVNTTSTLYYLRMYNTATAPTCSSATGFIESIPIPQATGAGAGVVAMNVVPQAYSTGISFCLTGGGSSTDNTNAATGVYVTTLYK